MAPKVEAQDTRGKMKQFACGENVVLGFEKNDAPTHQKPQRFFTFVYMFDKSPPEASMIFVCHV